MNVEDILIYLNENTFPAIQLSKLNIDCNSLILWNSIIYECFHENLRGYRRYGEIQWKKIKKLHSYQGIQLWGNVQKRLFSARVWNRYLIGSLENFILDLFRWRQFSCPAQRFYNGGIKYSLAIALYPGTLNISFVCEWKNPLPTHMKHRSREISLKATNSWKCGKLLFTSEHSEDILRRNSKFIWKMSIRFHFRHINNFNWIGLYFTRIMRFYSVYIRGCHLHNIMRVLLLNHGANFVSCYTTS